MEDVKKSNETKPTTFRFTDDDVQKFKELASNLNLSQSEMFAGLVNTFEMDNAKQSIPDRAKEIETFQVTSEKLKSMFLNSLEINQTSESRIREEMALELKTKDQAIADLQEVKADAQKQFKILIDQSALDTEKVTLFEKAAKEATNLIAEKTAEAQDMHLQIKTLADQLNYQTNDLVYLKNENADLTAKNKTNETAIATHQGIVQDLKSQLEKYKNDIATTSEQKAFYKTQVEKLEMDIQKRDEELKILRNEQKNEIASLKTEKDNAMNALRDEQKTTILALRAEIKVEKEEAVTNAVKLKTAEFELIKLSLNNTLAVKDEQIAILQAKCDSIQIL